MLLHSKTQNETTSDVEGEPMQSMLPGYRLDRLEVYNWGTFDSVVHSICPHGKTTLLIGENGSGKSTLVDALLTLLVRPQTRNYNVAAGAGKNERDERSYIRGAYDRTVGEGGKPEVQVLRPGRGFYTVLLAVFNDATTNKAFTIAQVLFLDADGSVEKHYAFSDRPRTIVDDLGNLTTSGLAKQLKERGFKTTTSYKEYFEWLRKTAGFRSKAMDIFNQTVAVKDVQRLDVFIRRHMLESKSWQDQVGQLLRHFHELSEAHRSLVRIRKQFELLQPIVESGTRFRQSANELSEASAMLSLLPIETARRQLELLEPECKKWESEHRALQVECSRLEEQIENLRQDAVRSELESESAGTDRFRALPALIAAAEQTADSRTRERARFEQLCVAAGIDADTHSPAELSRLTSQLEARKSDLQTERSDLQARLDGLKFEMRKLREKWSEDRRELRSLERSQGNLPESFIRLREKICKELELPIDELPFAAELMAVKPTEKDWEGSIEQVLFGFARSLLVPDPLYSRVAQYIDRGRLTDAHGHGLRLVYLRASGASHRKSTRRRDESSKDNLLEHKLDYRTDHPLCDWLSAEIRERFAVTACDTIEQFEKSTTAAMTRNRHFKSGTVRHEKDDRLSAGDRRHFVLGWDNQDKLVELTRSVQQDEEELNRLNSQAEDIASQLAAIDSAVQSLDQLSAFQDFEAIDCRRAEHEAMKLRKELKALENADDRVRTLKQRTAELRAQAAALTADRDGRIARRATLEMELREGRLLVDNCRNCLAEQEQTHEKKPIATHLIDSVRERLRPLTLESLISLPAEIERELRGRVEQLRESCRPAERELTSTMTRFLKRFPDEQQDLDAAIESLPSFCALFERISADDLPQHERRFKQRLNEKVLHEIGLFYGSLETEREEIRNKIDQLNSALRLLQWKPGSCMQLDAGEVQDREIIDFRKELAACLSSGLDGSSELDEAAFERIERLIVKLRDEENARWREKVIDVRNWFNFAAREIVTATGEVRSYYDGGAGQSGGEKGKLAFLVLTAAIAYQYDIRPETEGCGRFHFVMVDEMFSRSDDRHAEYALELFERFQLQLLIVAPLDAKARVTEPYVGTYAHVVKNKQTNRSELLSVTAKH